MSHRIDTSLLPEIQKYGADDFQACISCGNCTAVCPLTDEDGNFPRRLIRYAQLGMKERLAASKDVWMCYYCGECSSTCPREAEPGEFMAAARRFAIAQYDVTGLSKILYKSGWFNIGFTILITVLFSLFLLSFRRPAPLDKIALFEFIPEVYIQISAISLFVLAALITTAGVIRMVRGVLAQGSLKFDLKEHPRLDWLRTLWHTLVVEFLGQKRYRTDGCEEQTDTPWYVRKWFIHATIVWGFLGLFAATGLDFLTNLVGIRPLGMEVPLYYPMRLLGTLSGLAMMYGTTVVMVKRFKKVDQAAANSHISDWMPLVLLWLVGFTGFLLEIAVYSLLPAVWGYGLLIFHVALAMDLLLLLPVSKFAHVLYRTLAIFLYNLKPIPQQEEEEYLAAAS